MHFPSCLIFCSLYLLCLVVFFLPTWSNLPVMFVQHSCRCHFLDSRDFLSPHSCFCCFRANALMLFVQPAFLFELLQLFLMFFLLGSVFTFCSKNKCVGLVWTWLLCFFCVFFRLRAVKLVVHRQVLEKARHIYFYKTYSQDIYSYCTIPHKTYL